jgi:endoglucanase
MSMMRGWQRTFRRHAASLAVAIAVLGGASNGQARPGEACIDITQGVPADTLRALSRGVNLAGWMDRPGSPSPAPAVLRTLRKAGMTHVRLPVPAESVMRRFTSENDLKAQLRAIDAALTELISIGFHVSIDLHPSDQFSALHRDSPEQSMDAVQDAWRNLASIIRRHPQDWIFAELLNEPDIDAQRWQNEAEQLAKFVRQLLPQTTLIVGPTNWQRADSLLNFRPLNDPNVVYAVHFYDPMVFTHQGHWDPAEPLSSIRGLPFPIQPDNPVVKAIRQQLAAGGRQRALEELDGAIDQARNGDVIRAQLEPAVAWQKQFARPLIINEFGVLKAQAPPESRLRWLRSVVDFAEQHCWGWTHWELAQGFGVLNEKTGKPDADVMRALLGRP